MGYYELKRAITTVQTYSSINEIKITAENQQKTKETITWTKFNIIKQKIVNWTNMYIQYTHIYIYIYISALTNGT